jgi:8-oxo-dGTP pyrophosphatase MutT (NUDIX family)
VSLAGRPPGWLRTIVDASGDVGVEHLSRHAPPEAGMGRASAVLALFGESVADGRPVPDVLLIERAVGLRSHAGMPAFPGGVIDPDDDGPVGAALREAWEETGLDPAGVDVLATLPDLWLAAGGYVVTPVLAWWRVPSPVAVVDPREVASVHRVPIPDLVEPGNRLRVQHPGGFAGPAFRVGDLLVWGFTAGILSWLLDVGGLAQPWDQSRVEPAPVIEGVRRQ